MPRAGKSWMISSSKKPANQRSVTNSRNTTLKIKCMLLLRTTRRVAACHTRLRAVSRLDRFHGFRFAGYGNASLVSMLNTDPARGTILEGRANITPYIVILNHKKFSTLLIAHSCHISLATLLYQLDTSRTSIL